MKNLKLAGAFDANTKESGDPDTLWSMLSTPDEHWEAEYGEAAREIAQGFEPASFKQSLGKAMTMARGAIPKASWNIKVLGPEFQPNVSSGAPIEQARALHAAGSRTPTHQGSGAQRTGKAEPIRAKRPNAKRSYREADYEGYEGYAEGLNDDGYSTGGDGEDRMGGRKRPKKVCSLLYAGIVSC